MCKLSQIKHGAVFMVDIPRNENVRNMQSGVRPVVAISNNKNLASSPCIHVVPLTTKMCKHRLPTHVMLHADFLTKKSICLAEQLMQISKDLVVTGRYIGTLSDEDLSKVKNALKIQLALA